MISSFGIEWVSEKMRGRRGQLVVVSVTITMMLARTKIEAFDQVIHTLELARIDLIEEATRYQKKKS